MRITLKLLLAAVILTTVNCVLLQAQQSSSLAEGTEETKSGKIIGRVVNESGQPLSNAIVYIRAFGTTNFTRTTMVDADGNFQISGLDTALYSIGAAMPAYVMAPRDPNDPQTNLFRLGDSVKLTLIKGGVLTGTITDAAGEPVVAVQVHAQMIRDAAGKAKTLGIESGSRSTDDRGVYRIYGLQPGTYVVLAGMASSFGFSMTAFDSDVPTYAPSSTRDTASEITVRAGDEITGVDIRYRGEPGHTISGSVIGAGVPESPSTYTVNIAAIANGKPIWSRSTIQAPNHKGFAINGLADGDYELWSNSFLLGENGISEPKKVKVKGVNVTGVELSTKPLASVSGHLLLEPSKAEVCKDKRRPQLAETVVITQRDDKPAPLIFERYLAAQASPGKDGAFTMKNLAPGPYAFSARFFARYWYLDSISLESPSGTAKTGAVDSARNWTVLKLGDRITGLNIKLTEGAASLRGQVKTESSQTIPEGLTFYLVPAEPGKALDSLRFYGSTVNADGSFSLNNLAPGRYWSIVRVPGENQELWKLSRPDQNETRLRLKREAEAGKKEVQLKLCENKAAFEWSKDK